MTRQRTIACLLAVLLVAALAIPAAAGGRGPFKDCETHWAKREVSLLKAAGILQGVGNGLFNPEGQLTRAEIAVMILRALGLENEAMAQGKGKSGPQPFKDAAAFPAWSQNHIRACFDRGLMLGELKGKDRFFSPMKPVTRQEFVVLLVRALNVEDPEDLEALAESLMGNRNQLAFKDRSAIADWAVGFVLVALDRGWVNGYDNGTFQPSKPVTRAEAAAFIERHEEQLGYRWSNRYTGTIKAVDATATPKTITITTEGDEDNPGADMTFGLAASCLIYVGKNQVELSALGTGWDVKVYAQDGEAVYIKASEPEVEQFEIEGTISAVDAAAGTITVAGTVTVTVKVTGDTEIEIDGDGEKTLEDLAVGMTVKIEAVMVDDEVVAVGIEAETPATP